MYKIQMLVALLWLIVTGTVKIQWKESWRGRTLVMKLVDENPQ